MKIFSFVIVLLTIIVSCNKNQNSVKKLDGKWYAVKYEVTKNNQISDYIQIGLNFEYYFDNCKLKKNQYCQLTVTISNDIASSSEVLLYSITESGQKMEITNPITNAVEVSYKIIKLSSTKVKIEKTDNNSFTKIVLIRD